MPRGVERLRARVDDNILERKVISENTCKTVKTERQVARCQSGFLQVDRKVSGAVPRRHTNTHTFPQYYL